MSGFDWAYRSSVPGVGWTPRDESLLRTAFAVHCILTDHFDEVPGIPVPFAVPGHFPQNRVIATAPFTLCSFQAAGDGSYVHDNGFFFATGEYGLALTAGVGLARAIGNSQRRNAAQADATRMWRPLDQGRIFINIDGFHLLTAGDLVTWDWQSIDLGQMVQRGQFAMVGNSEQGRVSYVIESDLAELVFFLWAAHRQPQHPQLYQRVWLLPEWLNKYDAVRRPDDIDYWNQSVLGDRALPPGL